MYRMMQKTKQWRWLWTLRQHARQRSITITKSDTSAEAKPHLVFFNYFLTVARTKFLFGERDNGMR